MRMKIRMTSSTRTMMVVMKTVREMEWGVRMGKVIVRKTESLVTVSCQRVTERYYAMLHCTALCYITALNRTTAQYYTVLYFTVLCYTVTLYYTVLPYTM